MGYDRGDSFWTKWKFYFVKKLSLRSYPIHCERKWKYSFLSVAVHTPSSHRDNNLSDWMVTDGHFPILREVRSTSHDSTLTHMTQLWHTWLTLTHMTQVWHAVNRISHRHLASGCLHMERSVTKRVVGLLFPYPEGVNQICYGKQILWRGHQYLFKNLVMIHHCAFIHNMIIVTFYQRMITRYDAVKLFIHV